MTLGAWFSPSGSLCLHLCPGRSTLLLSTVQERVNPRTLEEDRPRALSFVPNTECVPRHGHGHAAGRPRGRLPARPPPGVYSREADSTSHCMQKGSPGATRGPGTFPRLRAREKGRVTAGAKCSLLRPESAWWVLELRGLQPGWSVECARGGECPGMAGARPGRVSGQ